MKSLQNTIFFFVVALLLVVQVAFLHTIYHATGEHEEDQLTYRLNSAKRIFETELNSRDYYFTAFAETVAKDFGLKQVFQEDTRSFLVALNNHRQRISADIALAISADGEVIAQLLNQLDEEGNYRVRVGPELGQPFRFPQWLSLPDDVHLYSLQKGWYQLNLAPIKSGSLVIGWIGFGFQIDQALAQHFARQTGLNNGFVIAGGGQWQLLASSGQEGGPGLLKKGAMPESELIDRIRRGQPPAHIIASSVELGSTGDQRLLAVIYGSRSDLLAEIQQRWQALGLLAALILSVSLAGAWFIAARIGRPLAELKRQAGKIAAGNYDLSVKIQAGGELGELAGVFNEMQQAVLNREQTISHQAFHDDLTGLPNRNRLLQVLPQIIDHSTDFLLVAKLGVRRINDINSSLGHEIGDRLITEVGQRLQSLLDDEALFHIGGGEFVVIKQLAVDESVQVSLQPLMDSMQASFVYQSISLYIETQIGVALFPGDDVYAAQLLQKSATALQFAQQSGQLLQLYDTRMSDASSERLQLINDLKIAINHNQLQLYYQPKMKLASGEVSHVEALVRWVHPLHGMIPPDKFIAVAEQTGLINSLTDWVLKEAVRQYEEWSTVGINLSIAVNISAENLKQAGFYERVMSTLTEELRGQNAISLEMTESVVVAEPEKAIAVLRRFQASGVCISIDDYGTGYSSLAQLKNLPVSELKIDRSFVQNLSTDTDDQVIVQSTIDLAHHLNMQVVAEGIEDARTLSWLQENGCDLAQGYFISRPQPAAQLSEWLAQRRPIFPARVYSI